MTEKILLAVLAHPDDETFGAGGTLAYYSQQGVKTYLVCATRGEVGEMDPKYMEGFNSIAERREYELRCAAGNLGLTDVFFLDYRDSGMPGSPDNQHPQALAAQPVDKVAEKVVGYIRRLKPQVVITFDPIGGYHHPDHIAIHNATVKAFYAAADPDQYPNGLAVWQADYLYFQTMPRAFIRFAVRLLRLIGKDPRHFGKNGDIDLAAIAEVNFPVHARIDYRSVVDKRDEASACHASQGGSRTGGGILGPVRKLIAMYENFMQAYPEPKTGVIKRDLFG
jgi:LmbE family N-acetylglucosaminyl deacetylase